MVLGPGIRRYRVRFLARAGRFFGHFVVMLGQLFHRVFACYGSLVGHFLDMSGSLFGHVGVTFSSFWKVLGCVLGDFGSVFR